MQSKEYIAPSHLLFIRMTARSAKVGDIIKTVLGLREVLQISTQEDEMCITYRDMKSLTGLYAAIEVLVQ